MYHATAKRPTYAAHGSRHRLGRRSHPLDLLFDCIGDLATLGHRFFERWEGQRLIPVAHGIFWRWVDFNDQSVSSCRNSSGRHIWDQVGVPGAVARIHHDRQVGLVMQVDDGGQWQGELYDGPTAVLCRCVGAG